MPKHFVAFQFCWSYAGEPYTCTVSFQKNKGGGVVGG